MAGACRARGVLSVVDNTFASPINQQPLALGVDLAMQSATKYLNGHSDVTAGVVAGPGVGGEGGSTQAVPARTVLDPQAAADLGRGLKTLPVRMARHNANAAAAARFLAQDRRVARVYYPGLPSHPDHAIARSQMTGFGGMVSFDLDGRLRERGAGLRPVRGDSRATSLGGVDSLASLPVLTSQYGYSDEQLRRAGVTAGMLRISVGLEDEADLIADLDQALG